MDRSHRRSYPVNSSNNFGGWFDDMFDSWMDDVIERVPLRSSRRLNIEVQHAIDINQQLINNIYNIRRQLDVQNELSAERPHMFQRPMNIHSQLATPDMLVDNIINNLFGFVRDDGEALRTPDFEDVKITLSEGEFNALSRSLVCKDNINKFVDKECSICIEYYHLGDVVTTLPCDHQFHKGCIKNWLCNENINCPVCRKDTRA
jgi:hypothetical protein